MRKDSKPADWQRRRGDLGVGKAAAPAPTIGFPPSRLQAKNLYLRSAGVLTVSLRVRQPPHLR